MAAAWLWVAPRGRLAAVRQLALAGGALLAVALAWPVLVWLTPASSRAWVSGTSDNSIWSLIWEYNGFGRLEGQTGGPGGGIGGGGFFGGETGPLRLLNEALGGQAGWMLGLSLVGGLGIAAMSRLRRADPRTGWILAVGGAFGVTAVAFSFAGGIFHPYYVSLLAPFAAALAGATFAQARSAGPRGRQLGALALGAGAVTELVVIHNSAGELGWLVAPIAIVTVAAAILLLVAPSTLLRHMRTSVGGEGAARAWLVVGNRRVTVAVATGFAVLLIAPAIWSVDTLGHPTSGTFPAGGPETPMMGGPGGGGAPGGSGAPNFGGGPGGLSGGFGGGGTEGPGGMPGAPGAEAGESSTEGSTGMPGTEGTETGAEGAMPMPGAEGSTAPGIAGTEGATGVPGVEAGGSFGEGTAPGVGGESGSLPESGSELPGAGTEGGSAGGEFAPPSGGAGGMFGGQDLTSIIDYTEANGGGTIAVGSQSEAASSIIESGAEVAGIGGFSGKESTVSAAWLGEEIAAGNIRWILSGGAMGGMGGGGPGGTTAGDTRTGSEAAITTAVKSCEAVPASEYESTGSSEATSSSESAESSEATGSSQTLYDCGT